MFSRPVSSGWKPVPTSRRLARRPRTLTMPSVGSVMRDRILSKVLLPAPLEPMMAKVSPASTSRLTSFSAQNRLSSAGVWPFAEEPRRAWKGFRSAWVMASRKLVLAPARPPRMYCFETLRTSMTGAMSDHIRKRSFETTQEEDAQRKEQDGFGERHADQRPGNGAAQQGVAESLDHAGHGIDAQQESQAAGNV